MKNDSVPDKILNVLKKESRLTIKQIFTRTGVPEHRKEYHRLCIYRLLERELILKDGKVGNEYLYSLKKDAIAYNNPLYRTIIRKMIPEFIDKEISLDTTTREEDKIIEEEIEEVMR